MVFYHKLLRIKSISSMESVLIIIILILCSILILNLLYKLRSTLLWRVNCWFCNNNFWMKYIDRNSWMCPNCDQYNGFTKDGDYNKVLNTTNDQQIKRKPMLFQRSSPKNGLCKMCNVNQQLKVTLLANFVATSERTYDTEIKVYRNQLEKAYKLCSPCRKVVDTKLQKDMKTMLGYKHSSRSAERKVKSTKKEKKLQNYINKSSEFIAVILLALVFYECCKYVIHLKDLSNTIKNIKEIILNLSERFLSIVQMKLIATFPFFEKYIYNYEKVPILSSFKNEKLNITNEYVQELLGGFVCVIQIIGHLWSVNQVKYSIIIDSLWSVFVIALLGRTSLALSPEVISFVKISSVLAVFIVYRNMKKMNSKILVRKVFLSPKSMIWCDDSAMSDDENASADTDDDVSLSKYGLHNSGSSNGTVSPLNNSVMNGRCCTPRTSDTSVWSKPKINSTFCVNTAFSSPSSINDTVFVKPSFNRYQKITKDDSDSDLDESIGSLCISSPKKLQKKSNPIFSLRKFTATPSFVAPTPLSSGRPLITPSKLRASWVAGGYWGSEGDRTIFNINGSRSSSQSSGFESQTSSMTHRNVFSQPPSREESVCREPFKAAPLLDRYQNLNMSYNIHSPQNFNRVSSPVFPQMHYNSHVHIPQPRFSHQNTSHSVFSEPQMSQNGVFKSPNSSLIKLPQINDEFASH